MTVYVWDASSYDGAISVERFRQAMAEGVVAFVHRLTRQGGLIDPNAGPNLANARAAGLGLVGAYAVTYTSGGTGQDDLTIRQADQVCPWWRTFPGWWWMEDLERWPADNVPAALGMQVARELATTSGKVCALYASHGQYGNELRGWSGPLVNADYTSRPAGTITAMYPGDDWMPLHGSGSAAWRGGWADYSGRTPDMLQYTSHATIAGLTTCDASAYRGTYAQLAAMLTPGSLPAPPEETTMFLATDGSGQYYLCDGFTQRPISLVEAQIIAYGKTSGYGPTFPGLVVGDPGKNSPSNHEWVDVPKDGGGVYPAYARLNPGTWAGELPAKAGECTVDQDQLSTAVKNALSDPVVTSTLEQQINGGLGDRILSGRPA